MFDESITTFDWNTVPAARFRDAGAPLDFAPLPFAPRQDIGIAKMRSALERFVRAPLDELPIVASIADIHGNVEGLRRELTYLRERGIRDLVCTGDIVDRDPHSIEVIDELEAAKSYFTLRVLIGNHDLFFLRAMHGSARDLVTWLGNGGISLLSEPAVALDHWRERFESEAQSAGVSRTQWVRFFLAERPGIVAGILSDIKSNPALVHAAAWMENNVLLSHVSDCGMLYVHAGIPSAANGKEALRYESGGRTYRGLWALAKAEEELLHSFGADASAHPAYDFLEHSESPVWIRSWEKASELDAGACDRLLDSLGVSGIIVGHMVQPRTKGIQRGRLVLADRGLARSYQNQPAVVLVEPLRGLDCVTSSRRSLSSGDDLCARYDLARAAAARVLGECPE